MHLPVDRTAAQVGTKGLRRVDGGVGQQGDREGRASYVGSPKGDSESSKWEEQ
jgi:hypothetical protein